MTSWTDCARKVKSLFFDNISSLCNFIANALVRYYPSVITFTCLYTVLLLTMCITPDTRILFRASCFFLNIRVIQLRVVSNCVLIFDGVITRTVQFKQQSVILRNKLHVNVVFHWRDVLRTRTLHDRMKSVRCFYQRYTWPAKLAMYIFAFTSSVKTACIAESNS